MTYNVFGGTLSLTQSINQPSQLTWAASPPVGWDHLQPPSPFIQPESWHSFCSPMNTESSRPVCAHIFYDYMRRLCVLVFHWCFLANVNSSSCSLYVIVRPSVVCRLSSVCRLSVVCNVRAPYSDDWNFRQCFYAIGYLGHLLTSR